jgi:hypothetical protein
VCNRRWCGLHLPQDPPRWTQFEGQSMIAGAQSNSTYLPFHLSCRLARHTS